MLENSKVPETKLIELIPGELLRLKTPMELPGPGGKPMYSGSVNSFLIRTQDDRWAILDTGFATNSGKAAWEMTIKELKLHPENIAYILVTHYHPDHVGMAGFFESWTPAPIHMHPVDIEAYDKELINCEENARKTVALMKKYGMEGPDGEIVRKQETSRGVSVIPCSRFLPMKEGDRFPVFEGELTVYHAPGHTSGQCVLLWPEKKYIFGADMLLPITFSPIFRHPFGTEDPIGEFLKTLDKFTDMDIDDYTVLPGHGWPFENPCERARLEKEYYLSRASWYLEKCAAGTNTAWETALEAFEDFNGKRRLRSIMGESMAYLEYLVGVGKLCRREQDGVFRFFPVNRE